MFIKKITHGLLLAAVSLAVFLAFYGDSSQRESFKGFLDRRPSDPVEQLITSKNRLFANEIKRLEQLGRLNRLSAAVTISFDYSGKHITAPLQLNAENSAVPFILDSGASASILDRNLAQRINLPTNLQLNHQVAYTLLDSARFRGATFSQVGVFTTHFSAPGQPLHCLSPNGMIGANILRHGVWQINYPAQTLTLASHTTQLPRPAGIALPFRQVHHVPVVPLTFSDGTVVQAVVDTGWNGSLYLSHQDALRLTDYPWINRRHLHTQAETLHGLETQHLVVAQAPQVTLGTLAIGPVEILLSQQPASQLPSLIGNDLLEHYVVTLDWPASRLSLQPLTPEWPQPAPPSYGFQAMMQHHQLLVTGLLHPSPMAAAGGRIGDRILAINGDDFTQVNEQQYCDFVFDPLGERYSGPLTMTIQRGNNMLTLYLIPPASAE